MTGKEVRAHLLCDSRARLPRQESRLFLDRGRL